MTLGNANASSLFIFLVVSSSSLIFAELPGFCGNEKNQIKDSCIHFQHVPSLLNFLKQLTNISLFACVLMQLCSCFHILFTLFSIFLFFCCNFVFILLKWKYRTGNTFWLYCCEMLQQMIVKRVLIYSFASEFKYEMWRIFFLRLQIQKYLEKYKYINKVYIFFRFLGKEQHFLSHINTCICLWFLWRKGKYSWMMKHIKWLLKCAQGKFKLTFMSHLVLVRNLRIWFSSQFPMLRL